MFNRKSIISSILLLSLLVSSVLAFAIGKRSTDDRAALPNTIQRSEIAQGYRMIGGEMETASAVTTIGYGLMKNFSIRSHSFLHIDYRIRLVNVSAQSFPLHVVLLFPHTNYLTHNYPSHNFW